MFDRMIKKRSLSSDSAAAWEIRVIFRSGSIGKVAQLPKCVGDSLNRFW